MNLNNGWRDVTAFDLFRHGFVLLRETINDIFYLVLMIQWLTKQGKLIKATCETSHVVINGLVSLGEVFELEAQLLDMSTGRNCIGCTQNFQTSCDVFVLVTKVWIDGESVPMRPL